MRAWPTLLIAAALGALAGCASAPPLPPPAALFDDTLFATPSVSIDPAAALALSPAMRDYLAAQAPHRLRGNDRRRLLVEALRRGDLKLEYDAAITRTAAQAFEARAGNCLALVMMTAALAKELRLSVQFQTVLGEEAWDRTDDLYIAIGHVNLLLEDGHDTMGFGTMISRPMVVDFLPARDAQGLRTQPIGERTVVAMYLNNRAVESLARGSVDDAYWWAREAIRTDPDLLAAHITLGVVYRTGHRPELAEQVLAQVALREPDNLNAMSNRVLALRDLGRAVEADMLARRLDALEPHPPFSYFQLGMRAFEEGRYAEARGLFAKEVARAPYHHEFEYWLALSYLKLGDTERASLHLNRALQASTTRGERDLYAAKLERLKALPPQ